MSSPPPLSSLPAFAVTPLSSHTYSVNLDSEWCIGTVPNGGYVTALFMCVSKTHFNTTHPQRQQPHPVNLNLQFLRRTSVGPAVFTVSDTKLGARTSVIHVTLTQVEESQSGSRVREEVVGYITHSNLDTEDGLSLDTGFLAPQSLWPSPPPADLARLMRDDCDDHWERTPYQAFPKFRRATQHAIFYLPRRGQLQKPIVDEWVRFIPHGRLTGWTNESLGFLADLFPQLVEAWYPPNGDDLTTSSPDQSNPAPIARFWYPTLNLTLDIKKALPREGVPILFLRCRAKVIRNGRMDFEVVIADERGEIVAVAQHAALVMGVGRNMERKGDGKEKEKEGGSKL